MNWLRAKLHASDTSSIAEPARHVDFLDGLRGVAILMVIFFHSSIHNHNPHHFAGTFAFGEVFSSGVMLFFITSAYTLMLSSRARGETGLRNAAFFYARRALRILPLWWAVCLVYALFIHRTFEDAGLSMSFIVGFLKDGYLRCVSPVGWTLFVEESFYLFFPLWLALITSTWRAALALAIVFGCRAWYVPAFPSDPSQHPNFATLALANYFVFFIGILAWFLSHERFFKNATRSRPSKFFADAVVLISFIALFFVSPDGRAALCGLIFLAATIEDTIFRRLLTRRFLVFIGGLCYGLYLLHHIVEHFFTHAVQYQTRGHLPGEGEMILAFILTTIVTTAVAWLVFNYFEKPIVQRGRQWLVSFRAK